MNTSKVAWIGVAFILATRIAGAQTATAPLIHQSFEADDGGWQAMGQSAKVTLTHDTANIKESKGSLQFDYTLTKGELDILVLPTHDSALAKMKSLRFWIKADHVDALTLVLQEKDGGRYHADFTVPKDTWQKIELTPSDFVLSVGKDDPKDPDNRLDMDQVDSLNLIDFGTFIAQVDNADFVKLLNVPLGAHHLYLNDFTVTEDALPDNMVSTSGEIQFDKFARPQLMWGSAGEVKLTRSADKPLEGAGLQIDYREAPGKIAALLKPVPFGKLAGKEQISFTAASAKPFSLTVQVEEIGGGKYNTTVDLPGNSEKKEYHLSFSDFKPGADSQDADGKLDLDQVYQILFLDLSGFGGALDQDNTLWVNNLRVSATKP